MLIIALFGGVLTALIGIGVEKITFLYVTSGKGRHKLSTLRGGIVRRWYYLGLCVCVCAVVVVRRPSSPVSHAVEHFCGGGGFFWRRGV